jgi:hypothetical protein
VRGRLKYGLNWPSKSRIAGNLKVNGSPASFTQYSALSPITLRGRGLLTEGTLVRVCSLTAGAVTDCTYKDIHNGVFVVSGLDSRQGEDPASLLAVDMWMIRSKCWRYLDSDKNQSRNLSLPRLSSIYALAFWSVHRLRYSGTSPRHSFFLGLTNDQITSIVLCCGPHSYVPSCRLPRTLCPKTFCPVPSDAGEPARRPMLVSQLDVR